MSQIPKRFYEIPQNKMGCKKYYKPKENTTQRIFKNESLSSFIDYNFFFLSENKELFFILGLNVLHIFQKKVPCPPGHHLFVFACFVHSIRCNIKKLIYGNPCLAPHLLPDVLLKSPWRFFN